MKKLGLIIILFLLLLSSVHALDSAYWEMDEASGNISDASGNGHDSYVVSGNVGYHQTTLEYLNYSIAFDGTGDYFKIPDADSLDYGTGDFSAGCWFNATGSGWLDAFGKDSYNGGASYTGWFIQRNGGGSYRFATRDIDAGDGETDAQTYCDGNIYVPFSSWVHFVGVRENNIIKLYFNGTWNKNCTEATPTNVSNSVDLKIADFDELLTSSQFLGKIDQCFVLPYALTDEEILERYNNHKGLPFGNFTPPIFPEVELFSPDESIINNVNVTFNFSTINSTEFTLFINGSENLTGTGNYSHLENVTFSDDGAYNWYVLVNNTDSGQYYYSSTYNFSILFNYSYCEVLFPTEGYLDQDGNVVFNFTVVNSTYWEFDLNDVINETNNMNGNFSLNRTLPSGYYNWSVFCRNDIFQNNFTTALRNFTVFVPVYGNVSVNVSVEVNVPETIITIPLSREDKIEAEIIKRNLGFFGSMIFRLKVFARLIRL